MKQSRPAVHRYFFDWLVVNRHRLAILPCEIQCTDRGISFRFVGVTSMISGYLDRRQGLSIAATLNGECWDLLADFGLAEMRTKHGYTNQFVLPAYLTYHTSRQALWEGEVFEPFLSWCNETLAPSHWLILEGDRQRATWASLSAQAGRDPAQNFRIHLE